MGLVITLVNDSLVKGSLDFQLVPLKRANEPVPQCLVRVERTRQAINAIPERRNVNPL